MRIGLVVLGLCAGTVAAGCADLARVTSLSPDKVDVNSPVAGEVAAASRRHYPTPHFKDVPPTPKDIRAAAAYGRAATGAVAQRDQLAGWIATHPAETPTDPQATEAFAAAERAKIPADQTAVQPTDASAGTEEYAARLRALATPPPPPK